MSLFIFISITTNVLTKMPQSFQVLTIKQKSLRMIKLGKKLNELKQSNNIIMPRKISMPELTEEQKVKFEVRMRKIKKKKMFTSRIKEKRYQISSKVQQLSKKYENDNRMKTIIGNVVSTVEFPEISIFDEDIGNNDDYYTSKTLKKVNSQEIINLIKKVEIS